MRIGIGIGIDFRRRFRRILASDDFNRANNAASVGGSGWVPQGATGYGIINNAAYATALDSAAPALLFRDVGAANVSIESGIIFQVNEGIVVRATLTSDYITARLSSTGLGLFRVVGGNATSIGNYAFTPTVGVTYVVRITAIGSSIRVALNGVEQISVTETLNQTATKVGLRVATLSGAKSFDYFTAEAA